MVCLTPQLALRPSPALGRHGFAPRPTPVGRHRLSVRASYASDPGEDPYKVLELPRTADSTAILRAYRNKLREHKRDDAATARIEAAHSRIMMSALTSRLQGNTAVEKDILYADRATYFPWRPRRHLAGRKLILYSALVQALSVAYSVFNPEMTLPIVYASMAGAIGQLLKQNQINPPPQGETGAGEGMKNIVRGFFLAFLATLVGCLLTYTIPDGMASLAGRVPPFWFYQSQHILLTFGAATANLLFVALYR